MNLEKDSPKLYAHPRTVYSYFVWILCNIFNFYLFLIQFSVWVLGSHLSPDHIELRREVGTLLEPFILGTIIFQIPVALFLDRFGPRIITSLIILIAAIGIGLFGYTSLHSMLWVSIFLIGIGTTVTFANTFKLVSNWFLPKNFPVMVGWTFVASAIGAIIGRPLTLMLVKQFGLYNILLNYGMIGLLLAILFFVCIRDQNYEIVKRPEPKQIMESFKQIFREKQNYLIAFGFGLGVSVWLSFSAQWQYAFHRAVHQLAFEKVAFINLVGYLAFCVGVLFFSYLAKKTDKRKRWMGIGLSGACILLACNLYLPLSSFGVIMALSAASAFLISSASLAYTLMRERNPLTMAASSIAFVIFAFSLIRFIGDHSVGFILTSTSGQPIDQVQAIAPSSYRIALTILPLSIILSLVCLYFTKDTHGKQAYGK